MVNEADTDWDATITFGRLKETARLYRYRVTPADRDRNDLTIDGDAQFDLRPGAAELSERIPGFSVTVYTTYQLSHDEPGIITD